LKKLFEGNHEREGIIGTLYAKIVLGRAFGIFGDSTMEDLRMMRENASLILCLSGNFDRFARSLKMLVDSLALFQELGINFILVKKYIGTTASVGKLIFNINSAYSELSGI
jgi:Resolvase, N terminal domain